MYSKEHLPQIKIHIETARGGEGEGGLEAELDWRRPWRKGAVVTEEVRGGDWRIGGGGTQGLAEGGRRRWVTGGG